MDKVMFAGAVATTGGCGLVQGRSIQEMLLYVILVLLMFLSWQIGFAAWNCHVRKKRLERIDARRSAHAKPC